jgi:hypothetical protein
VRIFNMAISVQRKDLEKLVQGLNEDPAENLQV